MKSHIMIDNVLKKNFAVLIIVVNTFSWYFPFYALFKNFLGTSQVEFSILLATLGIHYLGAIGSAVAGVILVKKFSRYDTFLCLWMFIGVISSTLLIMLDTSNVSWLLLVSLLFGVSLGAGFPFGLAYFGDNTSEENRGRLGGILFFASSISMLLVGLLASMFTFAVGALIFTLWRGLGLVIFFLVRKKRECKLTTSEVSYRLAIIDKSFLLYFIPWVMFCLVNFLEYPIITNFIGTDLALLLSIAEFGIGGFSALIGGWLADSVGRKRIIIFGFIMLGIGYAVLGLFSNVLLALYLYIILDGIAWGFSFLCFV